MSKRCRGRYEPCGLPQVGPEYALMSLVVVCQTRRASHSQPSKRRKAWTMDAPSRHHVMPHIPANNIATCMLLSTINQICPLTHRPLTNVMSELEKITKPSRHRVPFAQQQ